MLFENDKWMNQLYVLMLLREAVACCRGSVLLPVSLPHCPCVWRARSWSQVEAPATIKPNRSIIIKAIFISIPSTLKSLAICNITLLQSRFPLHWFNHFNATLWTNRKGFIFQGPNNTKHPLTASRLLFLSNPWSSLRAVRQRHVASNHSLWPNALVHTQTQSCPCLFLQDSFPVHFLTSAFKCAPPPRYR